MHIFLSVQYYKYIKKFLPSFSISNHIFLPIFMYKMLIEFGFFFQIKYQKVTIAENVF